ncbi:MAG: DUF4238 domain-containing protein [Betaproteobacteria bacterium]|nr:DUF4238 domain-containing protein [Betaproteobacteria bacterium]MCX7195860.1 DUF4238 domain-containing protein [Pseudomonadota bacterium]
MASNKNQHFVPRCYLRPFTTDEDRKIINLFNIDRAKVILDAPIKSQCSRDYFYGTDDRLENAIQFVEKSYASALPDLLSYRKPLTPKSRVVIPRFWFLQHIRTEAASQRTVAMSEEADELIEHPTESFKLGIKEAVQIALRSYAENLDALDDLKIVLAYNKTDIPFITSDDPSVLTNRWLINSMATIGPGYGPRAAGVLCILPLSPRVCCICYDGHIYSIPNVGNWVDVRYPADVDAINDLQYLNCVANIYFSEHADSDRVLGLHTRNEGLKPPARHRIHYAIETESSNGVTKFAVVDKKNAPEHSRALIHMESLRVEPKKWPSILHWRNKGYFYSNDTGLGHVRQAHQGISKENRPLTKRRTGY